jgi:hypothetical protein
MCYDTILDRLYTEHDLAVLPDTLHHLRQPKIAFKTRPGIVTELRRCFLTIEAVQEQLVAIIVPELTNQAEEVFLYERVETEAEDEITSDEDLDNLEMDLE